MSQPSRDAVLVVRLGCAFDEVLADPDYGDASGHLGGDGLTALANAAIDTITAYLRETTDAIITDRGGRVIQLSTRDGDR